MSANVCKPQLTRQICPICAKFIQIRSSLFAQNNSIRIKVACMTLVKANCCSGIRMETKNRCGQCDHLIDMRLCLLL